MTSNSLFTGSPLQLPVELQPGARFTKRKKSARSPANATGIGGGIGGGDGGPDGGQLIWFTDQLQGSGKAGLNHRFVAGNVILFDFAAFSGECGEESVSKQETRVRIHKSSLIGVA
jgi:hypothetical protein